MTKDLKITIVQTSPVWENIDATISMFTQKLETISPGSTDLIVLPEMFNTGFTMNATVIAEPPNGKTTAWMATMAAQLKCVVMGSIVIKDDGNYFNRLIWMQPDGAYEIYDKRHLFRMGDEHKTYTPGGAKLIVNLAGWRICPLICYDLRFPVWSRNMADYDCLIYVASWPDKRNYAWRHLLIARAIENQCYVVGVSRIGNDGNGLEHAGYSVVLNFKGEPLSKILPNVESIETITLTHKELDDFRKEFQVGLDADRFKIE